MVGRPIVERRARRLFAYVRYNRRRVVVDVAIVLAWIVASAAVFRWLVLPQWLHYLVLFLGIAVYDAVTANWERPYRGPALSHGERGEP